MAQDLDIEVEVRSVKFTLVGDRDSSGVNLCQEIYHFRLVK